MRIGLISMLASFRGLSKRTAVVAIVAMFTPGTAAASIYQPPPIIEVFLESDVVILAKIDAVQEERVGGEPCGNRYDAQIVKAFKTGPRHAGKTQISFGRIDGLSPGRTYILFLRYISEPSEIGQRIPADSRTETSSNGALDFITCNGIVPGFEIHRNFAWEVTGIYVRIDGFLPALWPKSIRRTGWVIWWRVSKEDLLAYLEKLRKLP